MANSAHVYKSKSGNYNVSFHHPICREGSIGKKIHRSLKVSDDAKAEVLRHQLDELLTIAAETPTLLPTRSAAEQKYDPVVVGSFYDCMTPEPIDYMALREKAMPLPSRELTPHVLVAGATGVGKSRFVQQLLQTTLLNFPMRGAGRTTVSDTEIIAGDFDFSAVITFFAENEVRQIVRENILEACSFAQGEADRSKIASKLLVDADKRFRFGFVLGDWSEGEKELPDDEDDLIDEEDSIIDVAANIHSLRWQKLSSCVDQIISMTAVALEKAAQLYPEKDNNDVDDWLQLVDQEQVDALAEEFLGELERRLCIATGASSWPVMHRVAETEDKTEFFSKLQRFYQNNRKLFGMLVTPLVQGIRVRGRFPPPEWAAENLQSWVLLDGQGVGHEQMQTTNLDRTIPPELAKKFSGADIICLIDRAVPAMTGDAPVLLEHLLIRGYLERLLLIFTHFEAVNAPDLDTSGKKAKVLEGLNNTIQSIVLPKAQRIQLERNAQSQSYFLSKLNLPSTKLTNSTRATIKAICDRIAYKTAKAQIRDVRPVYNEYEIANIVSKEIHAYRQDWSESSLSRFNYKIIEALANWIGNAYSDGYPKRRLYPGQNLSERLVSGISIHLDQPIVWEPSAPSDEEQSAILNAIRSKVGDGIDQYCKRMLVQDPRTAQWLPAYQKIFGPGTKRRRARTVARILEDQAQLPDEGLGKFTKDIWQIVEDAIVEVCFPPAPEATSAKVA
jgi:hypothetical protein